MVRERWDMTQHPWRNCCSPKPAGLKAGESHSALETYPSPVPRPAPASHTPTNHQSLQQAGLPTAVTKTPLPPASHPTSSSTTAASREGNLLRRPSPPAPEGAGGPLPGHCRHPRRPPAPHEDLGDAEADARAATGDECHLAPGGTKGQSEPSARHSPRPRRPPLSAQAAGGGGRALQAAALHPAGRNPRRPDTHARMSGLKRWRYSRRQSSVSTSGGGRDAAAASAMAARSAGRGTARRKARRDGTPRTACREM